jgi:hypothetical protein
MEEKKKDQSDKTQVPQDIIQIDLSKTQNRKKKPVKKIQ